MSSDTPQHMNSISPRDFTAVTLAMFMRAVYNYEPGIGEIIEKMCGVFKNQDMTTVLNALLNHSMSFSAINRMSMGGYATWRRNQHQPHLQIENVGTYRGPAIENEFIGLHTDIMMQHHINQTGNKNCLLEREKNIAEVCEKWGMTRYTSLRLPPTTRQEKNISASWINKTLNYLPRWQFLFGPCKCSLIFRMVSPSFHDNMYSKHSKNVVEIIIPRFQIEESRHLTDIFRTTFIKETESLFSKVYQGLFVESLRRSLNLNSPLQMSYDYQHSAEESMTMAEKLDHYYKEYLETTDREYKYKRLGN